MLLNQALFERNKNCGYVLKPVVEEDEVPSRMKVNIISGQQLFKGTEGKTMKLVSAGNKTPHVHLTVKDNEQSIRFTTKAGQNVFNPIWKEQFEFEVKSKDFTFLHFKVTEDALVSSKLIA